MKKGSKFRITKLTTGQFPNSQVELAIAEGTWADPYDAGYIEPVQGRTPVFVRHPKGPVDILHVRDEDLEVVYPCTLR